MADPTSASLHSQSPNHTDLLIRSLSTALALFAPNSGVETRYHQSLRYDQFDRMSLFFVSGAAPRDASAITTLVEGNQLTFRTMQAQSDASSRLADTKNPENRADSKPTEHSEASADLSLDALDEPARRCLEWGPKSISPETHGAILEHLLRVMYQAEITEDNCKRQGADHLHRYIYSFCADNILRRFNSKIPGFKLRYVTLLLSPTDNITLEDYRAQSEKDVVLPQKLAARDDSRLHRALKALYPSRNFKLSDMQPQRLILDIESQWAVWTCFRHFLGMTQDCLRDVQALKGKRVKIKEDEIQSALKRLDGLKQAMGGIFLLAHYSPTFWIVMERMAPLLELRLGPETHGNHTPNPSPARHPGPGQYPAKFSPPSSTTKTGPDHHPSSYHSMATVDTDNSEESDDDDATSDAETTRNPSRLSARKTEQPEDLHDVISKSWSPVTVMVRHWMKSISQWHHGIEDLAHGPKKLGILSKSLVIDVTVAPMSPLPTRQTSLIDTIKSTSYSSDAQAALSILRENATSLSLNGTAPSSAWKSGVDR